MVLANNFNLTGPQADLLNRGLTFIPTLDLNRKQKVQILLDIQNYHRRLKLAAYFQQGRNRDPPRFTPTSYWVPPLDKLPPEIIFLLKQDLKQFNTHFRSQQEKTNLSQAEQQALRELATNKHIVIKPADKGSAVVILDREQYIFEANRQLEDRTYYKRLQNPIYLQTVPKVYKIVEDLHKNKFINWKQKQYLKGESEPRPRRFYMLPKIHKNPEQWTVPFRIPPGRPIVSDCGSETYQTAEYIDYFLNPLSVKHPSYVKDTYHFIGMIKNLKIPHNSLFFTIDIDSLYTNIDTKAGLTAVKNILQKYPQQDRPDRQLLALLEINLTRNDFEFNNQFFLQIKGVAMGKKFAPAYANIFMAEWEEAALGKCPQKPFLYVRYLDDIFGIWTHSQEEFTEFIQILDTHDPSIRLKHKSDHHSIDFLDTTVYKGELFQTDQSLDIKVFFKETDTHSLLFKTSFHPTHTYKGLIKSQLIRFQRICTQDSDFMGAVNTLFAALKNRGYCRSFLRRCLRTFRNRKPASDKDFIPLITTFSSASRLLNNKFKKNFREIIASSGLLDNHQVISAYRRNKNLKDYLVRARLPPIQPKRSTNILSDTLVKLEYVQNRINKTIYKVTQIFTPQTCNCVYIIFCSQCGTQYIGETKNSISTRMTQHRYNIRHKKETHTLLVKHFISHGWQSLRVAGIQNNSGWTDGQRKKREREWIHRLNTKEPWGLNMKNN